MGRVHTYANGDDIFPSEINAIQDDYEGAFSGWKTIATRWALLTTNTPTYLGPTGAPANNNALKAAFVFQPSDLAGTGPRGVQLRARFMAAVNAVAPAALVTCGLWEVTAVDAASGSEPKDTSTTAHVSLNTTLEGDLVASTLNDLGATITWTPSAETSRLLVLETNFAEPPASGSQMTVFGALQCRLV